MSLRVLEQNRLIAEFMGGIYTEGSLYNGFIFDHDPSYKIVEDYNEDKHLVFEGNLSYNNDWYWLMPVVLHIESLGYFSRIDNIHLGSKQQRCAFHETDAEVTLICDFFAESKIEAVYNCVIAFIKWYNLNKKGG